MAIVIAVYRIQDGETVAGLDLPAACTTPSAAVNVSQQGVASGKYQPDFSMSWDHRVGAFSNGFFDVGCPVCVLFYWLMKLLQSMA